MFNDFVTETFKKISKEFGVSIYFDLGAYENKYNEEVCTDCGTNISLVKLQPDGQIIYNRACICGNINETMKIDQLKYEWLDYLMP